LNHPIVLSLLLGLSAAVANGFGGFIIVQKHWDRSYLKYFVALGSGFMLAVSLRDMLLESIEQSGAEKAVACLLGGYLLVHLF
jgi:zinc and cadmium transporter